MSEQSSGRVGVRVSITDQLTDPSQRREVSMPCALPSDILSMRFDSLGTSLPALIGLRTVLETKRLAQGVLHQWKLTVSPDNPLMRRRFLSEVGTLIDTGGGQVRGRHASYNMVQAFEDAHAQLSELGAPEPLDGTAIQLWFGYKIDGKEFFQPEASSLVGVTREHDRAKKENGKRELNARICFPFTSFLLYQRNYKELPLPRVPSHDEWKTMHTEALSAIFSLSFKPCMISLWKAVYATNELSDQLRECGFPIDKIGKTIVGDQELRSLIRKQDQAHRRTFMYNPDDPST